MNTEDISAHRTYIPADYMLSPNSALEGAAFESKGMKKFCNTSLRPPSTVLIKDTFETNFHKRSYYIFSIYDLGSFDGHVLISSADTDRLQQIQT